MNETTTSEAQYEAIYCLLHGIHQALLASAAAVGGYSDDFAQHYRQSNEASMSAARARAKSLVPQ